MICLPKDNETTSDSFTMTMRALTHRLKKGISEWAHQKQIIWSMLVL